MRVLAVIMALIAGPAGAFEAGELRGGYLLGEQIFGDAVITRQVWLDVGPDTITATYVSPTDPSPFLCAEVGFCAAIWPGLALDYRLEGNLLVLTGQHRVAPGAISSEAMHYPVPDPDHFLYILPLIAALDGQRIKADADGVLHLSERGREVTLYPMTLDEVLMLRAWLYAAPRPSHRAGAACAAAGFHALLARPETPQREGFLALARLLAALMPTDTVAPDRDPFAQSPEAEALATTSRLVQIARLSPKGGQPPDSAEALLDMVADLVDLQTLPLSRDQITAQLAPHAAGFPAYWALPDALRAAAAGGRDICDDISLGLVPAAATQ